MADRVEHMLTTVDNPFDPFTAYDSWLAWDEQHGYYTNELLARIVVTSDDLSDLDQYLAREQGIDEAVLENTSGLYRKVSQN